MNVASRFAFLCLALPAVALAQNEASAWNTPQGVARVFQQACLLTAGDAAAAVDWALSQGFEPTDAMRGSMDGLLAGQPGSVLVAPGTEGHVLLAAANGQQCTVWAEQMSGPSLRIAMAEMLGQVASKGPRVQLLADRNIERSGAWRNQAQWRYRAVGSTQDLGVGVITTLSTTPGTQALRLEPLPATPAFAPDGVPLR